MMDTAKEIDRLRGMKVPELVEQYTELFGKPPRVKHREWLWKRCCWRLQEIRLGGLSETAKKRLEELIAELDLPLPEEQRTVSGALKKAQKPGDPPVGTTLVRQWHGQEVRVQVLEGGFEHGGVVHRSLSALAKAITGAHWNGRLFFGLTQRRRQSDEVQHRQ